MAVGPVDPREVLKGVENLLGKDGELRSLEGVARVFSLMKASHKMVSRCMYLNILLHTRSHDILNRFIRVGGYKLLNAWLTYSKTTTNTPLLQLILLTLQKLPLTVDHLKQNNTAKLVKQLSKSGETEELRKLASVLVDGWMAIIRSQSVSSSSGTSLGDKKKKKEESKKEEGKPKAEAKAGEGGKVAEEEKKRDKPKAHAPSHAKIRSTGLEVETPTPVPAKKPPSTPQLGDKYNIKPPVLKRPSTTPSDTPPVEKKYKPLNTTPNSTKEIKVKIIPAQPMECTGFLDALNSAPVPGIKIKKKKKPASPTSTKPCPFESKSQVYPPGQAKPSSPEGPASHTPPHEATDVEQPGTPVPSEDQEAMDTSEKPNALSEPRGEEESLTKKGKKKKSVRWAEEEQLKEYFYFDLDETERVNVNKIKDFGEAARRELMMDRQTFEMARRLSHDTMEERVPWTPPRPISLSGSLVTPGANSTERLTQRDREMGILQEIFLSKESVPDCPHEPDPEPYEPTPPKLIPLDEDSSTLDESYLEPMDTSAPVSAPAGPPEASKLPPVLANLMGSLGGTNRSPQTQPAPGNNSAPSVNVQELLTSIMGAQSNQSAEDLIKQPDFSHKIKQLLGSLQQPQPQAQPAAPPPVNTGLLGHAPPMAMNMPMNGGYPPNKPPSTPQYSHPPPPHNHAPPYTTGGGPRMMGPPRGGDGGGYWNEEPMRGGGHHRGGGHFHRGRGGRGGDPGYRGRGGRGGGGGPRGGGGGPNNSHMGDMSNRPVCRHFMMKGSCRYENNCAFYHPGVNGPPLP
ncbi:serine/threonine-protein phosphatase 1 regulatory subunit 10 [Megalops cyprinoides]|uniref:serine/threonine-protein phosphatase 1 regulatory subunit 10 n=1 Tax=Megalops cyprinoides TaxID=118141 RepID=UPI001864F8B5|nr:serine/threonine-protein phosphatase 1 regulatory subunit 10 [Megalops cyprinoides]